MGEPIRIFIVDDLRLLREGLVSLLAEQPDITVIGAAASGHAALEQIKALCPQVALIDSGLPGKEGLAMTRALRRDAPAVKVMLLGLSALPAEILGGIEAGAAGYVLQDASFAALLDAIRAVHRRESVCSSQIVTALFSRIAELANDRLPRPPLSALMLTTRELDILNGVAHGLSNKEIAHRHFIALQTVKNHIHNILDKLHLQTRREAVAYARDRDLLKERP
jgi:DNA-binding NarL/FixJ family response regulator